MKKYAILMYLGILALGCGQSDSQDAYAIGEDSQQFNYLIIEQKIKDSAFTVSVITFDLDNARDISAEIVSANAERRIIRVLFYEPGSLPDPSKALIRYDWTQQVDLTLRFDNRFRELSEEMNPDLPDYEVLRRVAQINGRDYGDILIPSIPCSTPTDEIEQLAIDICIQENLDDICLYCTEEAFHANYHLSYAQAHPEVLRNGFLCIMTDERFRAGSMLYP